MDWSDEGVILATRAHGETSVIAEVLTRAHGRHLGLIRGGRGRRMRPVLQTGNHVAATWRARLSEHLGHYALEPIRSRAARLLDDTAGLAGLNTLCALGRLLPERDPHPGLYDAAQLVLDAIGVAPYWPSLLARWELELLSELGFGLDLTSCAATGATQDLIYVSPKSGRAVSRGAGAPYAGKLLRLPTFMALGGVTEEGVDEALAGFALTGHFLRARVFEPRGIAMPEARDRLIATLERRAGEPQSRA